jgi:hypothetical protein
MNRIRKTTCKIKLFLLLLFFTNPAESVFGQNDIVKIIYPNYWSSEREYNYIGLYIDSSGEIITSERITLQPSGEIWEADSRQTLMNFTLDSISAKWEKFPEIQLNGKPRTWTTTYKEGVLQTPDKIWMHPIRKNQYILTELAPFPEIIFPVRKDTTWKETLFIYETFGTFKGTVESTYAISGEEMRSYAFGKLKCWKIIATGIHDTLGINSVIYYFNPDSPK